jgi:hypothetical protein
MALNPSLTTLSGLDGDRPTNPGYIGVFYFATDTGATFCWDGSAWQEVTGPIAQQNELDWLRMRVDRISRSLILFGINLDDEVFGP